MIEAIQIISAAEAAVRSQQARQFNRECGHILSVEVDMRIMKDELKAKLATASGGWAFFSLGAVERICLCDLCCSAFGW
jgi:hypothetical protein